MKLYLIRQTAIKHDAYTKAVVVAESADDARLIHPLGFIWDGDKYVNKYHQEYGGSDWAEPKKVHVMEIGESIDGFNPGVVICAVYSGS